MSLKEKVQAKYKNKMFVRVDDNGSVFYFSSNDFEGLRTKPFNFINNKNNELRGRFYYYDNHFNDKIVIFEHGMGVGHRPYMSEINHLAKHGFIVYGYDHNGSGNSMGENIGGFSQVLADLDACLNTLNKFEEFKKYDVYIMGHSMGGYSTLNIVALHPYIKKVVAISPISSVKQMHKQIFTGFSRFMSKYVAELERKCNPDYYDYDAVNSLSNFLGKALIMHSKDDKLALYKYHFLPLKKAFKNKDNINLVSYQNKNHNPNYQNDALSYKDYFNLEHKQALKNNSLNTSDEKEAFKNRFDWKRMTKQDEDVWKVIFDFLDN